MSTQNGETSLVLFERGAMLLQQANTIQKAKELRDISLTAMDWANRREMGDAAVQFARSYALEAERRMGELLASTERAKGAAEKRNAILPQDRVETLAEIGISKNQSSRAQALASIPRETFEKVKTGETTISAAINEAKPPKPKPPTPVKPAPSPPPADQDDDHGSDLAHELQSADSEIKRLSVLVDSLKKDDLASEVTLWHAKFDSLNGRVQQLLVTEGELKKTVNYQNGVLEKIRKVLGVDRNSEILPKLKEATFS